MFCAFLFHSLLCGCLTLIYFIIKKLMKVSPSVCYLCDRILFLYYAFPTMLLSGNQIPGKFLQIYEREDIISFTILPERTGEAAVQVTEFAKFNLPILMKVWCVVFACLLLYICCKNLIFTIRMSKWTNVNHWTHLNWWKPPSGNRKEEPLFTDRVYTCSIITSPVFRGIVHPALFFPEDMTEEKSIRLISSHHETHHKRKDILFKLTAAVISAIHWFNPFVWLLYACFQEDCEISCVCKTAGNMTKAEKETYLQLLTQYAGNLKGMGLMAAFGFGKQFQKKSLRLYRRNRKSMQQVQWFWQFICCVV